MSEEVQKPQKKTFVFDKETRTWSLSFYGWDEKNHTVILEFEKPLTGMSWSLIEKSLRRGLNVGIYLTNDDGTKGPLQSTIRLDIPNLWPDRNPHQVYSANDIKLLYHIMVRDAHNMLFQRLADGWRNKTAAAAGALDFNFEYKQKEN